MSDAADLAPARANHRRQPSTARAGGAVAQPGAYIVVVIVAVIGSVVLCTAVIELISHHVLHHALAQLLLLLAALAVCPAIAAITMSLTAAHRPVRPARRAVFSVIAVIAVMLAELGVFARVGLGRATPSNAAMQQAVVAYGILLGLAVRALVRGIGDEVPSWWGWICLAGLIAAWYASRPGPDAVPQQTVAGGGYPNDWPDPLIELVLLAVLTQLLSRYAVMPRREGAARSDAERVLRALVGPAVSMVFFAFTRDPAALALALGSVALWWSLEHSAGRTVRLRMWLAVGIFVELVPFFVLAEARLDGYRTFSFDSVFRALAGPRPLPVRTGAVYWVAPANVSDAKYLVHLVPASAGDGTLMNIGLFVLAVTLGALTLWLARQVRDEPARALATALAAFVAVQCLTPFAGVVELTTFSLSIPLLSGSQVWGIANAIALGTVVGLAQRGPKRPPESSTADLRPAVAARKGDPNVGR